MKVNRNFSAMQIYLVGGAVRDQLLNLQAPDRDWVVVGAHPRELLELGYRPVGKDFPVFLHPETQEEYALARQERKTAAGYTGFAFDTSTAVTLEDDLKRRDLTINAMAMDQQGNLVDPYGGYNDLQSRQLRHVSDAFIEDPVRILRVARFAARYSHLGFSVAEDTQKLMAEMVTNGEVDHLVSERVWKEFSRALSEPSPWVFIEVLKSCGALNRLLPELDALFGTPQPRKHHPEVDCGVHALLSLQQITTLTLSVEARFATLMHDLGKGTTPETELPSHHGHEIRSLPLINQLCDRLAVPNNHRELALAVAEFHTHCHRALELTPKTLLGVLKSLDAFRRPERFELFCYCCQADAQGRTGLEQTPYPQAEYLRRALDQVRSISNAEIAAQGHTGAAFGQALHKQRLDTLTRHKNNWQSLTARKPT